MGQLVGQFAPLALRDAGIFAFSFGELVNLDLSDGLKETAKETASQVAS